MKRDQNIEKQSPPNLLKFCAQTYLTSPTGKIWAHSERFIFQAKFGTVSTSITLAMHDKNIEKQSPPNLLKFCAQIWLA